MWEGNIVTFEGIFIRFWKYIHDHTCHYHVTNKSETCDEGQNVAFVFAVWGISPLPLCSNEVPVVLR
jgi:hypothetical protein